MRDVACVYGARTRFEPGESVVGAKACCVEDELRVLTMDKIKRLFDESLTNDGAFMVGATVDTGKVREL